MSNPVIRVPQAVYDALKAEAAARYMPMSSFIAQAVLSYIEKDKPNPVKEAPKKEGTLHLRAAQTKAEQKEERERQKRQLRYNQLPEFSGDGYAVYRGELSDWTPADPGEGYTAALDQINGETVYVRMPIFDYEVSKVIVDNRYNADLPEGLEDDDEEDG